ncbi:MAG: hypothetical protein IJA21_03070 [Clostridia bacterium]|nr:hypothetical protein [Clostridia bacterium]
MKRFKEFLIMFFPFLGLSILSVLWFVFNTSSGDFFGGAYFLKLLISPFLIIALFNTFVIAGAPALLLTSIFAILFRNKKSVVGRKKYFTYLFLISLIAPVVIILIFTRTFDFVNNTIYSLQIGILVVFIHWIIEWIIEKCKNRKKIEKT